MSSQVQVSNDDVLDINSLPEEIILKIFGHISQNQLGQIAQVLYLKSKIGTIIRSLLCLSVTAILLVNYEPWKVQVRKVIEAIDPHINRVCKRWNVLIKSPVLWKKVDVKLILRHESYTEIVANFVNTLPFCVTCIRLDFTLISHHFDCLKFEDVCVKLQEKCPSLEILVLDKAKLSDSLSSIIDLCILCLQKLRVLVFRFCIFPDCPARDLCDGISKIEVLDVSCCHFGSFTKPPFSRMPDLKTLRLANTDVDDFWFEDDISFLNQLHVLDLGYTRISSRTFQGICTHAFNLKELYLCWANPEDDDFKLNLAVFPYLKTICIRYCRGVEVTCEAVVFLIQSCESLQNIYVTQQVAKFFRKHPFVVVNKCNYSGIVKVIDCDVHQKVDYLCK